jgi:hypothetical protein
MRKFVKTNKEDMGVEMLGYGTGCTPLFLCLKIFKNIAQYAI